MGWEAYIQGIVTEMLTRSVQGWRREEVGREGTAVGGVGSMHTKMIKVTKMLPGLYIFVTACSVNIDSNMIMMTVLLIIIMLPTPTAADR